MRKLSIFLLSLLIGTAWLAAGILPAKAAAPLLSCRLEISQLNVGAKTTLWIEVKDIADFYAYQLELRFSHDLVKLLDADSASPGINYRLGDFISPDFVVLNEADAAAGSSSLALTQMNPTPARAGSGWIAQIEVEALKSGSAAFMFNNVILANTNAEVIAHDLRGCVLEVLPVGQPTRAASPTLLPTYPVPTFTPPSAAQLTALAPTPEPTQPAAAEPDSTATATAQPTAEPAAQQPESQPTDAAAAAAGPHSLPTPTTEYSLALPSAQQGETAGGMPQFVQLVLAGMGITLLVGLPVLFFLWKRGKQAAH